MKLPGALVSTALLAFLAILAFAGNSLLTRAALSQALIGAGAFGAIRLAAGAAMLLACTGFAWRRAMPRWADGAGIAALLAYMAGFSFAYRGLGAATGALILFASVQMSMAGLAAWRGVYPSARQILGLALAFGGLAWLLAPGILAPPLLPALLMAGAGAAWGVYTLIGRGSIDALATTTRNFIGAAPLSLVLLMPESAVPVTAPGAGLAIAAGALTSGLGYAIWYRVLPRLSVTTAGAVQLLVPVIAAAGAGLWLNEQISPRLVFAGAAILTGIALTLRFQKGG